MVQPERKLYGHLLARIVMFVLDRLNRRLADQQRFRNPSRLQLNAEQADQTNPQDPFSHNINKFQQVIVYTINDGIENVKTLNKFSKNPRL